MAQTETQDRARKIAIFIYAKPFRNTQFLIRWKMAAKKKVILKKKIVTKKNDSNDR